MRVSLKAMLSASIQTLRLLEWMKKDLEPICFHSACRFKFITKSLSFATFIDLDKCLPGCRTMLLTLSCCDTDLLSVHSDPFVL